MAARRQKQQWTDEQRGLSLAVIDAQGSDMARIAKARQAIRETYGWDIPARTLSSWYGEGRGRNEHVLAIREQTQVVLSERLEKFAAALISQMEKQLDNVDFRDASVALGITIDKILLLKGSNGMQAGAGNALTQVTQFIQTMNVQK